MDENIALIVALVLPVVLFAILRINASLVFLSLCLGAVLVQYVGSEADTLIHLASPKAGEISSSVIQFSLLLAPAAITCLVTIFSVQGRTKNMINLLPAVASAALFVLLAVPAMPHSLRNALQGEATWHYLSNAQSLVVSAGALVSLIFLWTQRAFFRGKRGHRH